MIKVAFFPCLAATKAGQPIKALAWAATMAVCLLFPFAAVADPITLKLSFFSSNRSMSYNAAVKPFVDAVNADSSGLVQIKVYFSGALGKDIAQQPQLLLDGAFDIAFIVPGYTPDQFPDNPIMELPGPFRDMRESTFVYTQLVALNALRGYEDFFVIGAYVSNPETIHGRTAINSIDDLKGKRIRVNNQSESSMFEKLGATPVPLPVNQISEAISSKAIDAAAIALTPLSDYGIKRVVTHHYLLGTSGAPLALLMNRKSFGALPPAAQDIIRKYSGEWAATQFIDAYSASDSKVIEQLKSDPQRTLVYPSQRDLDIAHSAFEAVTAEWSAKSSHYRDLLNLVATRTAKLRSSN
ncbi:MAG TPA: TRAP transporter substrate-binding protein DctP [Pseudolabrys sp.]|jgi:TRAP-type C4-dicarboxylate transport system substrate-binding protein